MILVVGGAYQGKTDYVWSTFPTGNGPVADGEFCTMEDIAGAVVLNHFHLLVKRLLQEEKDPYAYTQQILEQNPSLIIITNEMGYGVVPVDPFERAWRETTGRICCTLAEQAEQVHRVVCGLGQVIKG